MTIRHGAVLAAILIVLSLQFGVPALMSFADGPNRWGWQMYSRDPQIPEVTVAYSSGERESVDLRDYVYRRRYELQYDADVVARLCDRIPDASRIVLEDARSGEETTHQCDG